MIYTGEAIKKLLPLRDPVMMVDALQQPEGNEWHTTLLVRENNFFLEPDRYMAEPGLLEHIAQSANAVVGYQRLEQGLTVANVQIVEVKKFHSYRRPRIGELLNTVLTVEAQTPDSITLSASVHVGQEVVADTQLKMSIA